MEKLYNDPDLVRFYDIENRWADDFDFCSRLADDAQSILDLGCGTGLLAATFAEGGRSIVTGVDPAGAMLDVARNRPGGAAVRWIEGDARSVRLDRRFDLVVLTGHAFQVFLTRDDRAKVLRTIAHHLAPAGRFVFDTRNPLVVDWRNWSPERSRRRIEHPQFGPVTVWSDARHDAATGIVAYDMNYAVQREERTYSSTCRIAFPDREEVADLLNEAGLAVQDWYGDWKGRPYDSDAPEIIPVGTLR